MKITIDIDEASSYSLTPYSVYRALYIEYWNKQKEAYQENFCGMANTCDNAARDLYSSILNRQPNVKNLILTYKDAENCFELFKKFADVWISNYMESKKENNE